MNIPESNSPNLERVDQEIRIEKLKREIERVSGSPFVGGTAPDCDPAIQEAFLMNVLALETHGFSKPFDVLRQSGLTLPSPDELNDAALTIKLWEVIRACASRRLFLESTDHLSDRELYTWLWRDALREELMGFGLPFGNCHLDVLGACGEEELILSLRYYANDRQRAQWAADFPDFPMPAKETPPFDRDRYLPRPELPD